MSARGLERLIRGGQSVTALPRYSEVDLLGDGERIIDLDAEVSDRALHLRMSEEQLNGAEVPGSQSDSRRAYWRVERQAAFVAAAVEQKFAGTLSARPKVLVDRLARLLGDLEPDRTTGLALPNGRPVDCIALWRDVLDLEDHHVAATQLWEVHREAARRAGRG